MAKKPQAVEKSKCLTDSCENDAASRGLCDTCYASARRAIREGLVTEKKLMSSGLLLESRRGCRPSQSKFCAALERVLGK